MVSTESGVLSWERGYVEGEGSGSRYWSQSYSVYTYSSIRANPDSKLNPIALTISSPWSSAVLAESYRVDTPLLCQLIPLRSRVFAHSGMMIVRAAPTRIPIPRTDTALSCLPEISSIRLRLTRRG